jgi:hypothetical protein
MLAILAAAVAAAVPMPSIGQVNPEAKPAAAENTQSYKYEVYAGFAYTRLKQVNGSYSGLAGGKVTLTRDWGRFFQLSGSGDYYSVGLGHNNLVARGNPSVYSFMVAPGIHANLFERLSGQVFGEVGGEHTGGVNETPSLSFAGGFGGGLTYSLTNHLGIQLTGDRVGASFSLANNSSNLAYSTHRSWDARGTMGIVYRF